MNIPKSDLLALINGDETVIALYKKKFPEKTCKCCGKKFVAEIRSDEIYCSECRLIGYEKTMEQSVKEYRKRYKTMHARLQRGVITKDEFDAWKKKMEETT